MAEHDHDHHDGYTGPAVLVLAGREVPVHARLDAHHQPQDGRLHWFGRLAPEPDADPTALAALAPAAEVEVEVRTAGHRSPARLGDVDPWGRYRVTGVGAPPYRWDATEPG
ncbi:MAG TPA: DUF4873 domain-containing protein [Pseudonocardia sp.]|jgi:hypothetical protein|nr:DUF4873 domain-containing protein [Pseudonocardia sp.]